MNKKAWLATGASIAEHDKLNDSHLDLDEAFRFMVNECDVKPENPAQALAWLKEGYALYQTGGIIRTSGKPLR